MRELQRRADAAGLPLTSLAEQRGTPQLVSMSAAARDDESAAWLWQRSEQLTGVVYAF